MTIAAQAFPYTINRSDRRDRNRRRRWLDKVSSTPGLTKGCKAWLLHLATRSSDEAKPVWGMQTGQAVAVEVTDRQVRRYRAEAEAAGLIETDRSEPVQDREGRWRRLRTNLYRFVVPPARRKPRSHRADVGVRKNSTLKGAYETEPINPQRQMQFPPLDDDPPPWSRPPTMGFAALRATIGRG